LLLFIDINHKFRITILAFDNSRYRHLSHLRCSDPPSYVWCYPPFSPTALPTCRTYGAWILTLTYGATHLPRLWRYQHASTDMSRLPCYPPVAPTVLGSSLLHMGLPTCRAYGAWILTTDS